MISPAFSDISSLLSDTSFLMGNSTTAGVLLSCNR